MEVLPFTANDINLLPALQPYDWSDLRIFYRYYLEHLSFCSPVKVMEGRMMAGIGTTIYHNNIAWLAHIVVHPDFRKHGIGKFLTQSMVDSIDSSAYKTISLLATPLGEPVYSKIGFQIQAEYVFLKNETDKIKFIASPRIIPLKEKHLQDVYALDNKASGEDRSSRLQEYFTDAYIYADDEIRGFYLPSFGEGLIVAKDDAAGIELMKFRLNKINMAVLPALNISAMNFLKENNFKEYRFAKRMWLGEKIEWLPEMIYNRISGQIG
jgi:GNAT superfamily N-acetyltransferase